MRSCCGCSPWIAPCAGRSWWPLRMGCGASRGARESLQRIFDAYLLALRPLADALGIDLQQTGPVNCHPEAADHPAVDPAAGHGGGSHLRAARAHRGGRALAVAPVGGVPRLWFATAVFIPLEVHELLAGMTWVRVAAFVVNVAAVAYLLWTKRLFGLRGGYRAFQAEPTAEQTAVSEDATSAG